MLSIQWLKVNVLKQLPKDCRHHLMCPSNVNKLLPIKCHRWTITTEDGCIRWKGIATYGNAREVGGGCHPGIVLRRRDIDSVCFLFVVYIIVIQWLWPSSSYRRGIKPALVMGTSIHCRPQLYSFPVSPGKLNWRTCNVKFTITKCFQKRVPLHVST